jgi:signal transduction histidine kinase
MTDPQRLLTRMLVSAINAREQESDRVSRILHDEVGQVLSAVGLQLDALKLDYQDQVPDIVASTNKVQAMLEQAMSEVRALSYDLNPAVVERVGLQFALDRLIGRFRNRFPGSLRFLFDSSVRVPLNVGNAWYKIAEHAIENAIRHSQAGKIEVHVRPTAKSIALEVRDNGLGFSLLDAKLQSAGLGLLLMEHYAAQTGLDLQIVTEPGKGTSVKSCYEVTAPQKKSAANPKGRKHK